MSKICINCNRIFDAEDGVNYCPDDGSYLVPEHLRNQFTKNASVGSWILRFLIAGIPLVGFIFLIVWANDATDYSRKNWAIANLIWTVIIIFFSFLVWSIIVSQFI